VLLVTAATALAVFASLQSNEPPGGLDLDVRPVPFNPEEPWQTTVGPLRFRGGLWLRSSDPRFGGLSDLRVDEGGRRLLAVSDCGRGLVARLAYDARGDLAGLSSPELIDLQGPDGRPLHHREIDAEGLAVEDQGLVVAFEGEIPRLWRYSLAPPFTGRPRPVPAPTFGDSCSRNEGPELLASLDHGRLVVACEGDGLGASSTRLWVGHGDHWSGHAYPLVREGWGGAFRPTAATRHPDGGVLILERRYPPLGIRLVYLSEADLEGSAALKPRVIARLQPPLTVDNFEGLEARLGAGGTILLYLLSDDNGCAKRPGVFPPRWQRTLLLLFELQKC
jgi:hypothetical protein